MNLDNTTNQPSKFRTKKQAEKMMSHGEHIMSVTKLNLKLQ